MVELVGYVRRPEAREVAVEDVALHGLTEARGPALGVDLPPWREHERAAEREVRSVLLVGRRAQTDDVHLLGLRLRGLVGDVRLDARVLSD
jgi:hypothetical protein